LSRSLSINTFIITISKISIIFKLFKVSNGTLNLLVLLQKEASYNIVIIKHNCVEGNRELAQNRIISTIRDKEMDRGEFLKYMAYVAMGIIGLKGLISLLGAVDVNRDLTFTKQSDNNVSKSGFGGGKYGA